MKNFQDTLRTFIDTYVRKEHSIENELPSKRRDGNLFVTASEELAAALVKKNWFEAQEKEINELMVTVAELHGQNRELSQNTPKDAKVVTAVVPEEDKLKKGFTPKNLG